MKIIEGNYYKRRDGKIVSPLVRLNGGDFYWTIHKPSTSYTIGGRISLTLADFDDRDLVKEVMNVD